MELRDEMGLLVITVAIAALGFMFMFSFLEHQLKRIADALEKKDGR